VDDDSDIREIVDVSLGLNSDFELRSCASGEEALVIAAEWSPLLILLDVMMPGMDGVTTLIRLHKNPATAEIPVIFMPARAQSREIDRLIALGARGVISKPFNPLALASQVRDHLQATRLGTLRRAFMQRVKLDAALLLPFRTSLTNEADPEALIQVRRIAHGLAGAAGLFGFNWISNDAAVLEEAVVTKSEGGGTKDAIVDALDRLLASMESESYSLPAAAAQNILEKQVSAETARS
jgi:CheY-like chemotaxis protein